MLSRSVHHDIFCWLLLVASMRIMVLPIIKQYCFRHRISSRWYNSLTFQFSKEPASHLYLPTIATMFLMSQIEPQAVVHSVDCCVCVLLCFHSPSLKHNIFCNLLLFTLSIKNCLSDLFFPVKAATEWFPKKLEESLWANHYELNHSRQQHDIQCTTMLQCHTSPNAIDMAGWLSLYCNFFWVNPLHCIQCITFSTMMLILSCSLKIQPFGQVIFLLLLQYGTR